MFQQARLRLTAWYLLIILCISIVFSVVLYRTISREIDHFEAARSMRTRIVLPREEFIRPFGPQTMPRTLEEEFVKDAKERLILNIIILNSIILVCSGALGYFLAGKTLYPIQKMVDEQNRFISDASHELRTPLTSIKSSFEVFLRNKKKTIQEAEDLAQESVVDVDRLEALASSLLHLSRFERQTESVSLTPVALTRIIECGLKDTQGLANQKHITIRKSVASMTLLTNEQAACRILTIVLDNAIKYSKEKTSVTVNAKKENTYAVIRIIDQGIGIAAADLPHVFDRFYRADSSRTHTDKSGYGLGLSIAKMLIDQIRGSISIESEIDKGTTVTIMLPLA